MSDKKRISLNLSLETIDFLEELSFHVFGSSKISSTVEMLSAQARHNKKIEINLEDIKKTPPREEGQK